MLYFVPTPIGNKGDITVRGLAVLQDADVVLTEDPTITAKLYSVLEITHKPKMVALSKNHDFHWTGVEQALTDLKNGKYTSMAVVSDAGTPGISDPGLLVVQMAQKMEVEYTVLPGATALIPAVVASGLVPKEFVFLGFLPLKKGRATALKKLAELSYPAVLYESNHRIKKLITELSTTLEPDRKLCICREITKKFEQLWAGTVAELEEYVLKEKGEFVVVVGAR
jgi:16S rRNA (cytidine1402-2'-O)-methyltransferase